jgi:hypothetical protein
MLVSDLRRLSYARELCTERGQHGILCRAAVTLKLLGDLQRLSIQGAAGKLDDFLQQKETSTNASQMRTRQLHARLHML